jgi:transcriptional regulator with XRE-family HTH domain
MVSEALRMMRVFHDLTQRELADKLGISKSHVSEIESGRKTPTLEVLKRYSEFFEVPVSSILFFSEHIDGEINLESDIRKFISSKILALMNFIAERSVRDHI